MKNQIKIKSLQSSTEFIKSIEILVKEGGLDYIDAVVHYCEQNSIEIETVASIIKNSSYMKSNIQIEAENLNFLPKRARLPV
jgi:hypothetical protein